MGERGPDQAVVDIRDQPEEIDRLADRLLPERNRADVLARYDQLFAAGTAPQPWPEGPLAGRLLATSTWGPWDSVVQRSARWWMPWQGKSFDPEARTGLNRFTATTATRLWLKALFPGYEPLAMLPDRIEAFPFRNRVGPGELDPASHVLKIDYDFEANPGLIRRILDELVQVAPGRYLGKILIRIGGEYHRIGFFSLRSS